MGITPEKKPQVRLAIVGAGKGGKALVDLLYDDPTARIVGITDINPKAPGLVLAKRLRIPHTTGLRKLLKSEPIDIVIDVTDNPAVRKEIGQILPLTEVIGGHSAMFMWKIIEARIKSHATVENLLFEYQNLYNFSLKLTASDNLQKLYGTIVEYAINLTNTPAGSLIIFDEKRGEMLLASIRGFSKKFSSKTRWKVRKGGLTSHILNQDEPLAIQDVLQYPRFDNPLMLKEGIRSLVAAPLKTEGRIMGVLYVDDFKTRTFTAPEITLLSLLSSIAAMAIEKTRTLESTRLQAITDELTGLYNHRHFRQQLNLETNRAERYRRALTLLMIDIDHFKYYNDTNGHIKGNEVLKEMGRLLKEMSREVDIVARYGGEEFAIIMPETDRSKARKLAERLRKRVAGHTFDQGHKQPGKKLTVSIGVASFPENADTAFDLMEEADKALYEAKRAGRNNVHASTRRRH